MEWLGEKVYVYTDTQFHQYYFYLFGTSLLVCNRTIKANADKLPHLSLGHLSVVEHPS